MLEQTEKVEDFEGSDFFGSEFIVSLMLENNISNRKGLDKIPLNEMISSICTYIVSSKGRNFFPNIFTRNGALALQIPKHTQLLSFTILRFERFINYDKLRKYFIYLSYCILRGHIDIESLQRTSNNEIPSYEEWYANISSGPYASLAGEELLLDDIARLAKYVSKGRISNSETKGALDSTFNLDAVI